MSPGVLRDPGTAPAPLAQLTADDVAGVRGVLCDIDDTLTWRGRLIPEAFDALAALQHAGLKVVPVTGRPGGWVDQIARLWPVDGVVGENGGLWFYMDQGRMQRRFLQDAEQRLVNRQALAALGRRILAEVPGCALASDQPYRELDLAIDFCEDVPPLPDEDVDRIVALFEEAGARCKVSSIHVNGWFGAFDKLTGCGRLLSERWGTSLEEATRAWLYVGDSANDEPMFAHFHTTVGVANVTRFLPRMRAHPRFITPSPGGSGFAELAARLLELRGAPAP